jgi:hypothetical protein
MYFHQERIGVSDICYSGLVRRALSPLILFSLALLSAELEGYHVDDSLQITFLSIDDNVDIGRVAQTGHPASMTDTQSSYASLDMARIELLLKPSIHSLTGYRHWPRQGQTTYNMPGCNSSFLSRWIVMESAGDRVSAQWSCYHCHWLVRSSYTFYTRCQVGHKYKGYAFGTRLFP